MAYKKRERYFLKETIVRPVSKKDFLRVQKEEMLAGHISKQSVLSRRVFTEAQISTLIRGGILHPMLYKRRLYFKQEEVVTGIGYLKEPPSLFPLAR